MKNQLFFFFLLLLCSNTLLAQINPGIVWQDCLGGSGDDRGRSIQQTADGGFIVTGYVESNDYDVSGLHGGTDTWVVKFDPSGNIEWKKALGGDYEESGYAIIQTADGGFIAASESSSNNEDVSGNHQDFLFALDIWVAKLDAAGNIEWQNCYGGNYNEQFPSIQQTSDGGFIISAATYSNDEDVAGNHGGFDYWVLKLDVLENISWQKCLGGSGTDIPHCIIQTSDGGYFVAGESVSSDGDVAVNHANSSGNPSVDCWVLKLDASANITWQQSLGGSGTDYANAAVQTADGGFAIAGASTSQDGDVTGNHDTLDYWIVKLNASGVLVWEKSFGGTLDDVANSIDQANDGGFIVLGSSASDDYDVTGHHPGYDGYLFPDWWIVKLNSSGNMEWQKSLGGGGPERGSSIRQISDGEYIIAGSAKSTEGDVIGIHYDASFKVTNDYWVVKLQETTGLGNLEFSSPFSIYPIPADAILTVSGNFVFVESLAIRILDITGKELFSENLSKVVGNFSRQIDLSNFSEGTYLVEMIHDGSKDVKRLVIQK